MPTVNKILKYELGPRTIELSVSHTTGQIADILKEDLSRRGISDTISQPTVARFLRTIREERSDQAKAIVHEYLKATLPSDLHLLDEALGFHVAIARDQGEGTEGSPAGRTLEERSSAWMKAKNIIETKLKYSGVLDQEQGDGKASRTLEDLEKDLDPEVLKELEGEPETTGQGPVA
jgi:hypothetical protein